jgi:hypothetical protein
MMTALNGRWSGHFSVNKTLDMVWQRYYCLQVRPDTSNVTPVQPVMATEQGLGPNVTVQHWNPIWKNSHPCSMVLPTEQPRKLRPPDRYGLFYKVAGNL